MNTQYSARGAYRRLVKGYRTAPVPYTTPRAPQTPAWVHESTNVEYELHLMDAYDASMVRNSTNH